MTAVHDISSHSLPSSPYDIFLTMIPSFGDPHPHARLSVYPLAVSPSHVSGKKYLFALTLTSSTLTGRHSVTSLSSRATALYVLCLHALVPCCCSSSSSSLLIFSVNPSTSSVVNSTVNYHSVDDGKVTCTTTTSAEVVN